MRKYAALVLFATFVTVGAAEQGASPFEQKILELTNAERQKVKLPPLKGDPRLHKIAQAHSENMAKQGKLEHVLDGKTQGDRMRAAGYKFQRNGENVGMGDDDNTAEELMDAWMASPGHRANILHTAYSEIGIGMARAKNGMIYFTQLFAKPK